MHDDYLWDASGDVDADVAALERTLAPLRYEAEPLRMPRAEPVAQGRPLWWIPVLAGAAAAAMVLVIASQPETGSNDVEVLVERPDAAVTVGATETRSSVPEVFVPRVPTPPTPPASLEAPTPPPKPPAPPKPSKSAKPPERANSSKRRDPVTVDCVLEPSKCGAKDDALPETLSTFEIRKGIAKIKARALKCGKTHGVDEATTVKTVLMVEGRTGRVLDARVQSPWRSTPLGTCVARAMSKARFPRFRQRVMSTLYPIRFEEPEASVSVDCILGSEGCKGGDSDLPATLSSADIRAGMAPIKSKVRACGEAHDAPAHAKVKVKLGVSGKTGRVLNAAAMAPWVGKPLGTCVEAVVRKAKFPKFRKERLGVVYPFSFPGE